MTSDPGPHLNLCFDRKAVIPPATPEHPGQHLRSLALKAELLGPLQVYLKA